MKPPTRLHFGSTHLIPHCQSVSFMSWWENDPGLPGDPWVHMSSTLDFLPDLFEQLWDEEMILLSLYMYIYIYQVKLRKKKLNVGSTIQSSALRLWNVLFWFTFLCPTATSLFSFFSMPSYFIVRFFQFCFFSLQRYISLFFKYILYIVCTYINAACKLIQWQLNKKLSTHTHKITYGQPTVLPFRSFHKFPRDPCVWSCTSNMVTLDLVLHSNMYITWKKV